MKLYALAINIPYKQNSYTFEWDKCIPKLEREFLDILNEMVSCNSQGKPINADENRFLLHRNREPYNNLRSGINRTQTLTSQSPTMTHLNMAKRFHHFSHSMPEIPNTHCGNHHFTNTYQTA